MGRLREKGVVHRLLKGIHFLWYNDLVFGDELSAFGNHPLARAKINPGAGYPVKPLPPGVYFQ
jgi:hypothetical protein